MLRTLALLSLVASILAACSAASGGPSTPPAPPPSNGPEPVVIDASADGKTVTVAPGTPIRITLASNPTTGYGWAVTAVPDPAVVAMDSPAEGVYTATPVASGIVGSGGAQTWDMHAVKAGSTTFAAEYARPWESGVPPVQAFTVTLEVR